MKKRNGNTEQWKARNARPDHFHAAIEDAINKRFSCHMAGVMAREYEKQGKTDAAQGYRTYQLMLMVKGQGPNPGEDNDD